MLQLGQVVLAAFPQQRVCQLCWALHHLVYEVAAPIQEAGIWRFLRTRTPQAPRVSASGWQQKTGDSKALQIFSFLSFVF